ncbi:uncharacterized conserved protein [Longilinea arvoryzae]|uniref:Uncharacterized conserved protein n=1 Tax=Longilinea arvoryzae TaxID=360412 RepID=A0A0S7BFH7_9CHLR|nr:HepT-like ribonuclease domain-containing protein [Longilinea arvoryzae]GAP12824.1 uncharacterized conserved protein [Longilinea arvoryzae]
MDILEAIDRIDAHKEISRSTFDTDELLQIWFVHHLQTIGEAASHLSPEIRQYFVDVQWGQLIGMRQILVHGYFEVDLDIVWNTVQNNLDPLKSQIELIIKRLGNPL